MLATIQLALTYNYTTDAADLRQSGVLKRDSPQETRRHERHSRSGLLVLYSQIFSSWLPSVVIWLMRDGTLN